MKKIFILLASMFLLVGCVESVAVFGTGAANGKVVQSSLQTGVSFGIKKQTGKTPIEHAIAYARKNEPLEKGSCSSFTNKKELDICLTIKERIITGKEKIKNKKKLDKSLKDLSLSLQSKIDKKSKIKYLD